MKIDDILLLCIASHAREDVTKRRFITSDAQQYRMFRAITPRSERAKRRNARAYDAAEIDGFVEQLRFFE